MTDHATPRPSRMLWRGLTRACPRCGQRRLFRGFSMQENCPGCRFHFERIEGHWIGAIGINTIVSFGVLALTIVISLVVTFPDFPTGRLMIIAVVVSILVPTLFYGSSRTLWTAIDLAMRPMEPHETTPLDTDPTNREDHGND